MRMMVGVPLELDGDHIGKPRRAIPRMAWSHRLVTTIGELPALKPVVLKIIDRLKEGNRPERLDQKIF